MLEPCDRDDSEEVCLDDATLEAMCEHVVHETKMLRKATDCFNDPTFTPLDADRKRRPGKTPRDVRLHNAVLEASLFPGRRSC
jgi:hypothetical protein